MKALPVAATLALAAFGAAAQDDPTRPVRIIVPFAPGGSVIGTDAVAKSAPDGCTLLLMSNTHTVNESLIPNKPFQLMRDFVPIAPINYSDPVLVARADLLHGRVLHVLRDGALAGLVADAAFAHLAAGAQWHPAPMPAEEATDLQRLPATTRLVALRGGDETLFDAALPPATLRARYSKPWFAHASISTARAGLLDRLPAAGRVAQPGPLCNSQSRAPRAAGGFEF